MQLEINYSNIGQRIKTARLEKGLNQSELGALLGCSNNHISHIEVGQTKVSLAMLIQLTTILDKDFNYFLLDTPYTNREHIINTEISNKLKQCNSTTLLSVNKIIDILLEQQKIVEKENSTIPSNEKTPTNIIC